MIPAELGAPDRSCASCSAAGNGHFVLVSHAAHEIGADRPEAFTSLVSDFLERHAQFVAQPHERSAPP